MNDEMMKMVEGQLALLRPAPLSPQLTAGITAQISDVPFTWTDRFVAGFLGVSAAAALFIVATVSWQMVQPRPPAPSASEVQAVAQMKQQMDPLDRRLAVNDMPNWR